MATIWDNLVDPSVGEALDNLVREFSDQMPSFVTTPANPQALVRSSPPPPSQLSEAETLLLIARVLSQSENLRNKILLTSAPASSLASDIVKQDARISFTAALGVVQSYRLRIAEFRQTLNKEMQGLEESSLTIWDHLDEDYGVTE